MPDRECPFKHGSFLCDFDADLTFFHTASTGLMGNRICSILRIPPGLVTPAVRFHKNHVLLFGGTGRDNSDFATSLRDWLEQQGFATGGPLRVFRTSTATPIEDGFFTCLCVVNGGSGVPQVSVNRLHWQEFSTKSNAIGQIVNAVGFRLFGTWFSTKSNAIGQMLADFVQEEKHRIDGHSLPICQFLTELYSGRAPRFRDNQKLIFDFYDDAYLEFAAAVWSPNEMYLWSRPIQVPK